jgi:hypothetical protein
MRINFKEDKILKDKTIKILNEKNNLIKRPELTRVNPLNPQLRLRDRDNIIEKKAKKITNPIKKKIMSNNEIEKENKSKKT